LKRGKMLGGAAPRRGYPTRGQRDGQAFPVGWRQILVLVAVACLIVGTLAGFTVGADRQVRGGILKQGAEAAQRPDWRRLETLPTYVPDAFLVVVDPTFEVRGSFRSRGADTSLPRELVRQIHQLRPGVSGEARELVMAPVLERRASKREILELFVNRVYLGVLDDTPIFGVHHAAQDYFGKDAGDLTLSEAATLAGFLLEPRLVETEEVVGAIGARRNEVLRQLVESGKIDQARFVSAIQEPLGFQPGLSEMPMSRRIASSADTVTVRVRAQPQSGANPQPEPGGL